jgi:hypothetical protein
MFRCQGRVLAVSSVLFALLAASGLDAFLRQEPSEGRRMLRFLPTTLSISLALSVTMVLYARPLWQAYLEYATQYLRAEFVGTAFFLTAAMLVLHVGRRLRVHNPQLACTLILVASFGDVWYFQVRHFRLFGPQPLTLPNGVPERARLAVDSTDPDVWRYNTLTQLAIERHVSIPATNEGGLLPQSLQRLHQTFTNPNTLPAAIGLSGAELIYDDESRNWRPACGSLPRIRFCQGPEALDPIPANPPYQLEASDLERPGTGVATVLVENPQYLALSAALVESEWLIVADTFYPGWECRVDGVEAPIAPAHGCFRGVFLEPGQHRVEFQYRPRSFRVGAAGSAAGIVGLIGMLWLGRRHRISPADGGDSGGDLGFPPLSL